MAQAAAQTPPDQEPDQKDNADEGKAIRPRDNRETERTLRKLHKEMEAAIQQRTEANEVIASLANRRSPSASARRRRRPWSRS